MSVGTMRHLVRVVIPAGTDDGAGGQTGSDTYGPDLWADIRPVSAREQAIAGAVQSIATHRLYLHYDARVTVPRHLDRLKPAGTRLRIVGVRDPDGRQRFLEVDCAEAI